MKAMPSSVAEFLFMIATSGFARKKHERILSPHRRISLAGDFCQNGFFNCS